MVNFDVRRFPKSAIVVFTLLFARWTVNAQSKIDAKVDIAVVLSFDNTHPNETDFMKTAFEKLPNYFEMSGKRVLPTETKLRMAVLTAMRSNFDYLVTNWTSDPKAYDDALKQWTPPPGTHDNDSNALVWYADWTEVFATARENLFADTGMRAKVIVAVFNDRSVEISGKKEAEQLREEGVWLYVIANNRTIAAVDHFAGDSKRVFSISGDVFDQQGVVDAIVRVKEAIHHDLCAWDSVCRYNDAQRTSCIFEKWLPPVSPYFDNAKDQCKAVEPNFSCKPDDCRDECDKRWPWDDALVDCDTSCGLIKDKHRKGQAPKLMENCPIDFWCGTCAQTTTENTEIFPRLFGAIVGLLVVVVLAVIMLCVVGIYLRKRALDDDDRPLKTLVRRGLSIPSG